MSIDHHPSSPAGLTGGTTEPLGLRHLVPLAAVLLAPFAAVGGAAVVGADLVAAVGARRPRRAVLPSALVLALCLAVLVELVLLGPLVGWWLD